jgi:hypothetical protein
LRPHCYEKSEIGHRQRDNVKLMVNYIHTWLDFRQANPQFGEDQFDEVIGRVQLMLVSE